jgi:hypothetical protein
VVLAGLGSLSRWAWPEIEGLHEFKGKIMHSAQWETEEDGSLGQEWESSVKGWGDKRVGVIGVVSYICIVFGSKSKNAWEGVVCDSDRARAPTQGKASCELCPR